MDADVVIVGGGPAGLTCGMFAKRFGLSATLVEQMGMGGQLINVHDVKDYPGFPAGVAGWDLSATLGEHAQGAGVEIEFGSIQGMSSSDGAWVLQLDDRQLRTKAVVIATGCSPRPVPVPEEEKLRGRGIAYCATCDGEFFRGQKVAVVGGGDTGMSEATYLADVASEVFVLFQEPAPPAAAAWYDDARKHGNIKFMPLTRVTAVLGDEGVTGLRYLNVQSSEESELEVSGVFGAVGFIPNSEQFKGVLETDEAGFIKTDQNLACSVPGVFAAGDVRSGAAMQVAGAVGDGVQAALSVRKYLRQEG